MGMDRTDGYQLAADVTIQGVRAYDPTTAQWTSPDAYAGTTTDPGSQKPFMWNGNNPVAYSDPSGFCIEDACAVEIGAGGEFLLWGTAAILAAAGAKKEASAVRHFQRTINHNVVTLAKKVIKAAKSFASHGAFPKWGTKDDPRVKGAGWVPNPHGTHGNTTSSWGVIGPDGKFEEKLRTDKGNGSKGSGGKDHEHHNGGDEHLPPGSDHPEATLEGN